MQIVIMAGGLAKRLYPLTAVTPKSMIPVHGRPFLAYQLEYLKKQALTDIVLCTGHLSEQIKAYFRDGSEFGVRIQYSDDPQLGTGGALKGALPLLQDRFFVTWGDSYLPLPFAEINRFYDRHAGAKGLVVVYRNEDKYDKSNIALQGNYVTVYDKPRKLNPRYDYIDAGVSCFSKEVLDWIPAGRPASLEEEIFPRLIHEHELLAFETQGRFYEIGSFSGLKEFEALMGDRQVSSV